MGVVQEIILTFCTCVITCTVGQQYNETDQSNSIIQAFPGYRLDGHVIGTMTSSDIWSCVMKCTRTSGCLSLNVRNVNDNVIHCELTKSHRLTVGVNLIPSSSSGQRYLELQTHCLQTVGWNQFKSFAYKYVSEKVNAATARQRCRQLLAGADLLSISNAEEDQFVFNLFKDTSWNMVWIGLNDIDKEGTWVWYDGSPSKYTKWGQGEPNGGTIENCAQYHPAFKSSGNWVDNSCQVLASFVCKIPCHL